MVTIFFKSIYLWFSLAKLNRSIKLMFHAFCLFSDSVFLFIIFNDINENNKNKMHRMYYVCIIGSQISMIFANRFWNSEGVINSNNDWYLYLSWCWRSCYCWWHNQWAWFLIQYYSPRDLILLESELYHQALLVWNLSNKVITELAEWSVHKKNCQTFTIKAYRV